jgi:hypothetical protein
MGGANCPAACKKEPIAQPALMICQWGAIVGELVMLQVATIFDGWNVFSWAYFAE